MHSKLKQKISNMSLRFHAEHKAVKFLKTNWSVQRAQKHKFLIIEKFKHTVTIVII